MALRAGTAPPTSVPKHWPLKGKEPSGELTQHGVYPDGSTPPLIGDIRSKYLSRVNSNFSQFVRNVSREIADQRKGLRVPRINPG